MLRRARIALFSLIAVLGAVGLLAAAGAGQQPGGIVHSIEFDGTVDPASERWIGQALDDAAEENAALAIIRLDTPGGLVDSTREIVKDIIAAPMPVIVYVSPDGARAASAGLFITMAADVAAMAPQTNIGAATPVTIGPGDLDDESALGRKIENDAAAWVRALADGHGRNADLAEEMVREATSVEASVAERERLVDIVAPNAEALLAELDGFEMQGPKEGTLETSGLTIVERDMPLHLQLLQILVNPNVSFLLLLAGLLGIGIEVFNPGAIFPGAFGGVALLLGMFGMAMLPITIAGILLLVLGIGLIIAETQLPTGGILGAAGITSLAASGLLLFDTGTDAVAVSPPVIIVMSIVFGGLLLLVVRKVVAAHHRHVMTGEEELVDAVGMVRAPLNPVGQVFIEGALWRARPALDDIPIDIGYRVRVKSVEGLTLNVVPVEDDEASEAQEGA